MSNWAGRLVTFSKQGLGFWTNLGLGGTTVIITDQPVVRNRGNAAILEG
jgi:hypothetical protein